MALLQLRVTALYQDPTPPNPRTEPVKVQTKGGREGWKLKLIFKTGDIRALLQVFRRDYRRFLRLLVAEGPNNL
eukprot:scaffold90499_cov53-Attheya_sp.AAC.1